MSTTSILPPHPLLPSTDKSAEEDQFRVGEMVFMRSKRISARDIKRIYNSYGYTLNVDLWWVHVAKEYNKQIEYCKDLVEDGAYYMFHTKYIGKIKEIVKSNITDNHIMSGRKLYTVEWDPRNCDDTPDQFITRISDHFPENLISINNMRVMSKEEILEDVLNWAANEENINK